MFTLAQIKNAHAAVKSGADFPWYIQQIKELGVESYSQYVSDGHTVYKGLGQELESPAQYPPFVVEQKSDTELFLAGLKAHQAGDTDFPAFCEMSAKTGIEKWTVDTKAATCTYYDVAGNEILVEVIPQPK